MIRGKLAAFLALLLTVSAAYGSAYQASPRLVVILVIDQFRGEYLERFHDDFGASGLRLTICWPIRSATSCGWRPKEIRESTEWHSRIALRYSPQDSALMARIGSITPPVYG